MSIFGLYYWYFRNIKVIKASIYAILLIIILISFILLGLLFGKPEIFGNDAFLYAQPPKTSFQISEMQLTSPVAVAILAILISGSSVTLVTRCVEESLWLNLTPTAVPATLRLAPITISESRNVAQWSTGASGRLKYLIIGKSSLLRISGIFLLLCSVISPVLLSGISQAFKPASEDVGYIVRNRTDSSLVGGDTYDWDGFYGGQGFAFGTRNFQLNWYDVHDFRGELAFLTSLAGLPAPVRKDICAEDEITLDSAVWEDQGQPKMEIVNCLAEARIPGFQATCTGAVVPKDLGAPSSRDYEGRTLPGMFGEVVEFCSSHSDKVCVRIDRQDSDTHDPVYMNFTNSWSGGTVPVSIHFQTKNSSIVGEYTIIFGVYRDLIVSPDASIEARPKLGSTYNVVDCIVKYGWINITQAEQTSVMVSPNSFRTVSTDDLRFPVDLQMLYRLNPWLEHRLEDYMEPDDNSQFFQLLLGADLPLVSPWVFYNVIPSLDQDTILDRYAQPLQKYPIGAALLGEGRQYGGETVSPQDVGAQIERAWEMYNTFSWVSKSYKADITITTVRNRTKYIYNTGVLLYLLVPVIAITAGVWGRWWVADEDVVPGYDPVAIARSGAVEGVQTKNKDSIDVLKEEYEVIDNVIVERYQDGERYRFKALTTVEVDVLESLDQPVLKA